MTIPTPLHRIRAVARRRPGALAATGVVASAALSLLLPFAPVYDAWAWLVWGREVGDLDLDTAAGPSWKPLPVLLVAPLTPLGDAVPDLWLLIARCGWIAVVALAFVLALRLTSELERRERLLAGGVAAGGVLLLFDPFTPWLRQFAGGLSEPLLAALVLAAIERALARRTGIALALGFAASLLRPEAWPFLAAYGAWTWRREPSLRPPIVAGTIALAALWFVPDLIGSGDPLTGADRAREGNGSAPLEAIARAAELPLAALWPAAGFAFAIARRRGEVAIPLLAAGALAWIGVVAALAAVGYAGLPRFSAPAAALVCVLGGCGVAQLVEATAAAGSPLAPFLGAPPRQRLAAALAVLVGALALQGAFRSAALADDAGEARVVATRVDDLFAVADLAAASCRPAASTDLLFQTALAWRLERRIDEIELRPRSLPASGTVFVGPGAKRSLRELARSEGERVARRGEWSVYAVSCASSASGRRIAGVTGARR